MIGYINAKRTHACTQRFRVIRVKIIYYDAAFFLFTDCILETRILSVLGACPYRLSIFGVLLALCELLEGCCDVDAVLCVMIGDCGLSIMTV